MSWFVISEMVRCVSSSHLPLLLEKKKEKKKCFAYTNQSSIAKFLQAMKKTKLRCVPSCFEYKPCMMIFLLCFDFNLVLYQN